MSDSDNEGAAKVNIIPTFDGSAEKFQQWWTKFEGYANLNGFAQALVKGGENDLPTTDYQLEISKRNTKAVYALTMAFKRQKLQGIIHKSKTMQYKNGIAHKIVEQLKTKYMPADEFSKVEKTRALAAVKMKKREDPSDLVERLYTIANQYQTDTHNVPDEKLLTTMIGAVPKEYAHVVTRARKEYGTNLNIDKLEAEMREYWRITNGQNKLEDNEEGEVALAAVSLKCYNCGKEGHKAVDCRSPKRGRQGSCKTRKLKGKCNNCGKEGHKAADCWNSEANKDKRPAWFKPLKETAAAAVTDEKERDDVECLLAGPEWCLPTDSELGLSQMTFPKTTELLCNPEVWIADMGASTHSTPYLHGMTNRHTPDDATGIHTAAGTIATTKTIGDIKGQVHDQFGNALNKVKLQPVHHISSGRFNLFSVSRLQQEGWLLGGDKTAIWLTKSGQPRLVFDIVVPTKTGAVYAMYIKRANTQEHNQVGVPETKISIQQAHDMLGHPNEDTTRKTAKALGWTLMQGSLKRCIACSAAKAKRKALPKLCKEADNKN